MPKTRTHPFFMTNSLANPVLLAVLKSRPGALVGRRLAVVGYDGHLTGQPHELVVQYRLAGSTVQMRAGMPERKSWWRNVTAPHPVTLRLAGRDHVTTAHAERGGDEVLVTADVHDSSPLAKRRGLPPRIYGVDCLCSTARP